MIALSYSEEDRVAPYVAALKAAGVDAVPVAAGSAFDTAEIAGLVLSGGADLNPALYGQEPHPEAQSPDDARDQMELGLLREAIRRDIPILAICRGMQLFNVAHGGTLHQHMEEFATHQNYERPKREPVHTVEVTPGTKLAEIFGAGDVAVNSRHHQAVSLLGKELVISAMSGDHVIEGIERPDLRYAVAVQWHPEDQAGHDARQAKLFESFARACGVG
jgi:putative glutamine amidotransferase